jgi:hypothetical protein
MSEKSAPDLRSGQAPTPQEQAPTPAPASSERPAADQDLAQRYGVKRGMSRGRKITFGVFGFALLCGVAGYIAYNEANPKIQATVLSYVVNGQAINVTFEVDKKGNDRVECTLQAEDIKGDVIGSANVNVPADGRAKVVLVAQVNTTGTPNTAVVSSCTSAS